MCRNQWICYTFQHEWMFSGAIPYFGVIWTSMVLNYDTYMAAVTQVITLKSYRCKFRTGANRKLESNIWRKIAFKRFQYQFLKTFDPHCEFTSDRLYGLRCTWKPSHVMKNGARCLNIYRMTDIYVFYDQRILQEAMAPLKRYIFYVEINRKTKRSEE